MGLLLLVGDLMKLGRVVDRWLWVPTINRVRSRINSEPFKISRSVTKALRKPKYVKKNVVGLNNKKIRQPLPKSISDVLSNGGILTRDRKVVPKRFSMTNTVVLYLGEKIVFGYNKSICDMWVRRGFLIEYGYNYKLSNQNT